MTVKIKRNIMRAVMCVMMIEITGCSVKTNDVRLPWLIGAVTMALAVVALVFIILYKNRRQSIFLKREHERVRVMLDTLPIACFIGTVKGKIFDCNSETVKLFELKDKHEFMDRFEKDLSPEFQPDGQHSPELLSYHANLAVKKGKCVFNWMHQLPDKTPIPALVTLETVNYGDEKVVIAYIRDMREHTKMTEEIGRQNELLKAVNNVSSTLLYPDMERFEDSLLTSMSIMGNAVDVDRVCIWKNRVINRRNYCTLIHEWVSRNRPLITGNYNVDVSYDDILHSWWETLSRGECINKLVRDMSADERAQLDQFKILSIFITPVFVHEEFWGYVGYDDCRKERIFSDNEKIILRSAGMMFANAFIRNDMTNNIVEASTELIRAKDQAEKSNRSKSIFLSQMSHEIRTPMNAILGIAEIQLRSDNILPENQEAFEKIYEAGDLLLNIINDILDLSKIESGKLELVLSKYDIPSLINDTAQLNRMRYDSKPIELFIHVDENTPVDLLGDELRIKQILNNILTNAYKYTDEGKIEFAVFAESSGPNDDDITLVFRVSDTGQGMTESQLERLFEEYARFNLETNRSIVGVGLGMTITKRLVDLMGGEIIVKSDPGKGTIFTVRIPQKRATSAVCGRELVEKLHTFNFQSTAIIKKAQFIREYMPYGSVLVVDDVESNIYVIKGMLMPYGLKIDTAYNGFDTIKKIEDGNIYDIIFLDHMMPKMDGIETAKKLRDMGYNHTIVALTANAIIGRAEMFLKNGFDGFISKPIDSRELNLTLNDFIRNKKPVEVIEAARREMQQQKNNSAADTEQNKSIDDGLKAGVAHDIENAFSVLKELLPKLKTEADFKLFATTVHGLKSALANIGEMQLSNIALRLEQAANNAGIAVLSAETPGFMNMLRSMLRKLKRPETNDSAEDQELSNDDKMFLQNKLNEIKTACEKLNIKGVKTALSELKQKSWPPKINGTIEEISLYLIRGEYQKVISAADKVLN
ncbi:MAG: ATP-binding protein [Treponema sp.]|nr:ATP-binding protein [Treponema sp.]